MPLLPMPASMRAVLLGPIVLVAVNSITIGQEDSCPLGIDACADVEEEPIASEVRLLQSSLFLKTSKESSISEHLEVGSGSPEYPSANTNNSIAFELHIPRTGGASVAQVLAAQQERLQKLKPLFWVHVPKTGSSFLNTIVTHDGICPNLPDGEYVTPQMIRANPYAGEQFTEKYGNESYCSGLDESFTFKHCGISKYNSTTRKGHGVIMLRDPKQRLISQYIHDQTVASPIFPKTPEFKLYARKTKGMAVKMLAFDDARGSCTHFVTNATLTTQHVELAKSRLRTDFAFVGLTDRWEESICLFHAMFGGPCRDLEFANVRPGAENKHDLGYNVSAYGDVGDEFDEPLYGEAVEIFESQLQTFGVSPENCRRICNAQSSPVGSASAS